MSAAPGPDRLLSDREVIFEFVPVGDSLRVAAVDVRTGTEVSVVAPVNVAQHDVERLAAAKLARRLEALGEIPPEEKSATKKPRPGGRGWIA